MGYNTASKSMNGYTLYKATMNTCTCSSFSLKAMEEWFYHRVLCKHYQIQTYFTENTLMCNRGNKKWANTSKLQPTKTTQSSTWVKFNICRMWQRRALPQNWSPHNRHHMKERVWNLPPRGISLTALGHLFEFIKPSRPHSEALIENSSHVSMLIILSMQMK